MELKYIGKGIRVDDTIEYDKDVVPILDRIPRTIGHLVEKSNVTIDIVNSRTIISHPEYRDMYNKRGTSNNSMDEYKGISPSHSYGRYLPGVVCWKDSRRKYILMHEYGHLLDYYIYGIHHGKINERLRDKWSNVKRISRIDNYYNDSREYLADTIARVILEMPDVVEECGYDAYSFVKELFEWNGSM